MATIRKALTTDIESIKSINEECLTENYPVEVYKKLIHSIFVYDMGDELAGYIILAKCLTKKDAFIKYSDTASNGKKYHTLVFSLAVKEKYRGRGFGKALLKVGIDKCQNRFLLLTVRKSNQLARNLYKKTGFIETQCVSALYMFPFDDGIEMVLDTQI
jgi:ribosomal protein S18 acetylase RimI-like enzyme